MNDLFQLKPLVIGALLLPDFGKAGKPRPMSWLEDFVAQNLAIFVESGFPAMMIQDLTLNASHARPETIAIMAALGRFARQQFPQLELGIIVQAHDPTASLAIAHACDATFVRLKVFVGAMLKAEGVQQGMGVAARDYRQLLGREDIKILADVYDRTGMPLVDVPIETAANWAAYTGADGLILTGFNYEGSLEYVKAVRAAGIKKPLLLGGSSNEQNVAEVLEYYDGVIVSTALKRADAQKEDIIQWDRDKVRRFMDAARLAARAN